MADHIRPGLPSTSTVQVLSRPGNPEMNASPRINPVDCRTCGACCKDYRLWYPDGMHRFKYDDMIRIMYLTGVNARIERAEGGNWLIFDHPCKYLHEADGKYTCLIYDDPARPLICAIFPYTESDICPHITGKE